ncbi:creatininase family protein [Pararhizobium haloflavum]|uniref:creatininase family protein n=1 Tax=Pararhizobium haloflavum TaxID=2037914 RepID=UPI000C19FEAE|nr:creatininase family protein [Pararhizobium haloflavum]
MSHPPLFLTETLRQEPIEARDRSRWIAVLPLGAHEQHGPHLPFETDAIIAQGLAERVAGMLPAHLPVTFLPTEPVGYSIEHLDTPGTRSLRYDEAVERWIAIAGEMNRLGISKFVMLNAHGGNAPLMTIVATEARVRFDMLAVATSWTRFELAKNVIDPADKPFDIHGGLIETSMILALRPESVDMGKARDFPSFQRELAGTMTHLRAYGPHAFGWKAADLNPDGVVGDASAATAEKGERIIEQAARSFIELLEDVHAFDSGRLG